MKAFFVLLTLLAVPALAQESPGDGSLFDALKIGDWVTYTSGSARDLIDLSVIDKPQNTTIQRHREDLAKAQTDARAARTKYAEALNALGRENLTNEEREAKQAAIDAELDEAIRSLPPSVRRPTARGTSSRSGTRSTFRDVAVGTEFTLVSTRPYEVTTIRKDYLVLSDGTSEEFIAKCAIRLIRRKLPSNVPEKTSDGDQTKKESRERD
jgi:hypothetical protein